MIDILSNPSYFIPPLIAGVTLVALLSIALIWSRRNTKTFIFSGLLASIALRNFMLFAMRSSVDVANALIWEKIIIVLVFVEFLLFYHFTLVYTNVKSQRMFLWFWYFFLLVIIAFAPTRFIIENMYRAYP